MQSNVLISRYEAGSQSKWRLKGGLCAICSKCLIDLNDKPIVLDNVL